MKQIIKKELQYRPLQATEAIRELIRRDFQAGSPFCPPDQGDLLYSLARSTTDSRCLEVGFATGSTALYLLLGSGQGSVVSIDYRQSDFDYMGVKTVKKSGMSDRHELIEGNTNVALPDLLRAGARFDVIFVDGW
jgi:predicted O-methyltransferase YrrM